MANKTFTLAGWAPVVGGINKFVWSADDGKTWNDFTGNPINASDTIIDALVERTGVTLTDEEREAAKVNGSFQGNQLALDLSQYAGQKITITIAAVPASDETAKSLVLLYYFDGVNVPE